MAGLVQCPGLRSRVVPSCHRPEPHRHPPAQSPEPCSHHVLTLLLLPKLVPSKLSKLECFISRNQVRTEIHWARPARWRKSCLNPSHVRKPTDSD